MHSFAMKTLVRIAFMVIVMMAWWQAAKPRGSFVVAGLVTLLVIVVASLHTH